MITGISHITLVVQNLERTAAFLECIFDAKEVFSNTVTKYFLINDLWIALNKGNSLSERTYNHIAFAIKDDDYDKYISRVNKANAEVVQGRTRSNGEGRSIYFYDFDNHLFELHTGTLDERLKSLFTE